MGGQEPHPCQVDPATGNEVEHDRKPASRSCCEDTILRLAFTEAENQGAIREERRVGAQDTDAACVDFAERGEQFREISLTAMGTGLKAGQELAIRQAAERQDS